MITEIFLDLDGCFFDFLGRYKELYSMEPDQHYDLSKNKLNKLHKENFKKFINDNHFATLDILPGFHDAIAFFEKLNIEQKIPVCFLTSSAREEFLVEIERQKKMCLESHNLKFNMMIVPGKRYKCLYAKPGRLLLDDTKQNIDDWIHHGGYGLHHTSWENSFSIIKGLL